MGLAGPILVGQAIDNYVIPHDLPGLVSISLLLLAVYLAAVASIIEGLLMVGLGQHLVADIRSQLFTHIQNLSMAYHDSHKVGD